MAPVLGLRRPRTGPPGPAQLQRYNGVPAIEIQGQPAPGKSSGAAMDEMQKLIAPSCRGHRLRVDRPVLPGAAVRAPRRRSSTRISLLVVFLCLAALYESWSIPLSVMLVIPLGVLGAVLAATLRGLYNDVYFQVGLLTTIGLSAKNAILIVEFAEEAEKRGADAAARRRWRRRACACGRS